MQTVGRVLLIFAIGLNLSSCSEDNNSNADNFDRTLILANLADHVIIPAYTTVSVNTGELAEKVRVFNTDPNEGHLNEAK
ncbi:MAG: hypothetical protein WBA74_18770, partial [Cyclobacteriaceae bacterium]